jgi:hypothetical protein
MTWARAQRSIKGNHPEISSEQLALEACRHRGTDGPTTHQRPSTNIGLLESPKEAGDSRFLVGAVHSRASPLFQCRICLEEIVAMRLASVWLNSCQVSTWHRVLRSELLTHLMIAYQASPDQDARVRITQSDTTSAYAASTFRMSCNESTDLAPVGSM